MIHFNLITSVILPSQRPEEEENALVKGLKDGGPLDWKR